VRSHWRWRQTGRPSPSSAGPKASCAAYDLAPHNIAVNALSPSKAIMTLGLSYYGREFADVSTAEEFARAAAELVVVDPAVATGRTIGHLQVLDGSFGAFGT
jgi:7-alpha-hydroxysteroid dehydrogenase